MIHNIGYPDLVLNDTELYQEIDGVSLIYHLPYTYRGEKNYIIVVNQIHLKSVNPFS